MSIVPGSISGVQFTRPEVHPVNGNQIEQVLQLIDNNMQLSSDEATDYIRKNQPAIAQSLFTTGSAVVRTSAGELKISLADLEASAA